jgi:hypothetical protein
VTAEFVIDAYHRFFQIEKSFRMSKHDLQARPIYHRKRDSIEAHLTVVFAALAMSRWIEQATSWSIKKFVRTARRYRTIQIQAGSQTITAADPLPDDLRTALEHIHRPPAAHQIDKSGQMMSQAVRSRGQPQTSSSRRARDDFSERRHTRLQVRSLP